MVVDELAVFRGQRWRRTRREAELLAVAPCQFGVLAVELQARFAEHPHLLRFDSAVPGAQCSNGLVGDPEPFVGGLLCTGLPTPAADFDQMALWRCEQAHDLVGQRHSEAAISREGTDSARYERLVHRGVPTWAVFRVAQSSDSGVMPRTRSMFSAILSAASSSLMPCCCMSW